MPRFFQLYDYTVHTMREKYAVYKEGRGEMGDIIGGKVRGE